MSMTPGPWRFIEWSGDNGSAVVRDQMSDGVQFDRVARCAKSDDAQAIAALPDLVSALQNMIECYWGTVEDKAQEKALEQSRAALEKAGIST